MRTLADALGFPAREIRMRYSRWELPVTLAARHSLLGVHETTRHVFKPPWPGLLLTAGRRNEAAALWVARASQGTTRVVHLGRPWHHPKHFDLIISTSQYLVPPADNVITLDLPLSAATTCRGDARRFEHLPRPHIVLLIGGHSGALTLHDAMAKALATQVNALADKLEGSLLASTSARTPACAARHLQGLAARKYLWCWGGPDNPYQDLLASADAVVVTSDSASMFADALTTGKPVLLFNLRDTTWWRHSANYRINALVHRLAMRLAPERLRRDLGRTHEHMVSAGHAVWFGPQITDLPHTRQFVNRDLDRALKAVRALVQPGPRPGSSHQ